MARVTGIGGVFFKARDMARMKAWYRETLGLPLGEESYWPFEWRDRDDAERIGSTVWSLFPADTTYFDPGGSPLMVNYRVDNLEELLDELRAKGVQVIDKIHDLEFGRFGWIMDPEGNKIELWEPRGEPGQAPKE